MGIFISGETLHSDLKHTRMKEWLMSEIILKKLMKDKLLYMFVTITIKILTNDTGVIEFFVLAQNIFIRKIRIYYIKISQLKKRVFQ